MDYIAFLGPTGFGKTALLFALQEQLGDVFEVVSVDSVQVYKGLDIGSAKPTAEEHMRLKHHLIDLIMPHEVFDVHAFCQKAHAAILDIKQRGKIPILSGGTMLYAHSFVHGISAIAKVSEGAKEVAAAYCAMGNQHAWNRLNQWDAQACKRIQVNDTQRIQRAPEVFIETGKPLTYWQQQAPKHKTALKGLHIAALPENREALRNTIVERFHAMLKAGMLDELRLALKKSPVALTSTMPSMRSIGYRQAYAYLKGQIEYKSMIDNAIVASQRYMKRQLTWLRSWSHPATFVSTQDQAQKLLKNTLTKLLVGTRRTRT